MEPIVVSRIQNLLNRLPVIKSVTLTLWIPLYLIPNSHFPFLSFVDIFFLATEIRFLIADTMLIHHHKFSKCTQFVIVSNRKLK